MQGLICVPEQSYSNGILPLPTLQLRKLGLTIARERIVRLDLFKFNSLLLRILWAFNPGGGGWGGGKGKTIADKLWAASTLEVRSMAGVSWQITGAPGMEKEREGRELCDRARAF